MIFAVNQFVEHIRCNCGRAHLLAVNRFNRLALESSEFFFVPAWFEQDFFHKFVDIVEFGSQHIRPNNDRLAGSGHVNARAKIVNSFFELKGRAIFGTLHHDVCHQICNADFIRVIQQKAAF